MPSSEIHALLQRAARNGTTIDLTIKRSDGGGVSNSLRSVVLLEVGTEQVLLRLFDGAETSMALDEIVRLGVREQPRRSLPGAIADLLSFTR